MKIDFPYKEGDTVLLFEDYQQELGLIGAAKLVRFHKFGRSFILEDTMPETCQKVYSYQEWITDLDDKPKKIRFLEAIGITNSASDEVIEEEDNSRGIIDKFIEFNGIQIY